MEMPAFTGICGCDLMQLTTRSRRFLARAVLLGKWQGRKRLHFVRIFNYNKHNDGTLEVYF